MKLFLSSTITSFEKCRDAAARAAVGLRHTVKRSEDYGARPATPQSACLAGIREAEAVMLLIGARYGEVQPSGFSATHEEFREARETKPVLAFVQTGVQREPRQEVFVREVQNWTSGVYTGFFASEADLPEQVMASLHELEVRTLELLDDDAEIRQRALAFLPRPSGFASARLTLAIGSAFKAHLLRPAELDYPGLIAPLLQKALFGPSPVFSTAHGNNHRIEGDRLVLEQEGTMFQFDPHGSLGITLSPMPPAPRDHGGLGLIEEDLQERIALTLGFAADVLELVDPSERIAAVAPITSLTGTSILGWQTRAEHATHPNSVQLYQAPEQVVAELSPARRLRRVLSEDRTGLARDFVALLRRQVRR